MDEIRYKGHRNVHELGKIRYSADEEAGWERSKRRKVLTTHGSLRFSESFAFWQFRDLDQSTGSICTAVENFGGCFTNAKLACEDEVGTHGRSKVPAQL